MESIHLMIALIAGIAAYAGYNVVKCLSDAHERIVSNKTHSSDVHRLANTVDNALKVVQDATDVNRKLVSRMKEGDSILFDDKITLLQDGNELTADMILPSAELSNFYDIVKESQMAQEKSLPVINFKITIEYNSRGIKNALVIGIGEPREKSYPLKHFINK